MCKVFFCYEELLEEVLQMLPLSIAFLPQNLDGMGKQKRSMNINTAYIRTMET